MKINPLNITATYVSLQYGIVMQVPLFIKNGYIWSQKCGN